MDRQHLIEQIIVLEQFFEEGRQKAYSVRKILEQFSAPAPSGDITDDSNRRLIKMLNKRRKMFYKNDK